MRDGVAEAKQRLPLPALMHEVGLGEHAKKSARCPFHEDKHNSFSVYKNPKGEFRFKCFAGCGEGDEITFLELYEGISNGEALKRFLEMAGVNDAKRSLPKKAPTPTVDWGACVEAVRDADVLRLQIQRGYSREICSWLKENGLIGKYKDCFAFPVHDRAGKVVAKHYRPKDGDGKWLYHPAGAKVRPLVIGELVSSNAVHVFESYWDAFAFMDKSGERGGIIITRGSGNGKLVAGLAPAGTTVYAWKQNDELKNGRRAGDEWLKDVAANAGEKVVWPKTLQ
jgi:hypothetical protein